MGGEAGEDGRKSGRKGGTEGGRDCVCTCVGRGERGEAGLASEGGQNKRESAR